MAETFELTNALVEAALRVRAPSASIDTGALANIAVINNSTVVTDAAAKIVVAALQQQVTQHFAPVWGMDARLAFFGAGTTPPSNYWWLVILDDSDQAGALGYHDTTDQGLPIGKVFAKTDLTFNTQWSVTASHELLEMLADPYINLAAIQYPGGNNSYMGLYAYEVCDACEADQYGYLIDGILVSDFVFPSWFENGWAPNSKQFDYMKYIDQPLKLLAGGYISVYDVQFGAGWTQLYGQSQSRSYSSRAQVGSRRERRRVLRHHWQHSASNTRRSASTNVHPIAAADAIAEDLARTARNSAMRQGRAAQAIQMAAQLKDLARTRIAQERAQRHADFLGTVQHPTELPQLPGNTRAAHADAVRQHLRILAEGDSWFDYPVPGATDIINELKQKLGYSIDNMAQAGEEVRQMLALGVRREIIGRLSNPSVRYDVMLFSGGGDDLVGDQLAIYLKDYPPQVPPDQVLNDSAVSAIMNLLEAEYRQLIGIRDRFSANTTIITHCYDFPIISGHGVCFHGPWLQPALNFAYESMGIAHPSAADEGAVVKTLLQRFRTMLKTVESDPAVSRFIVIDTQGTLSSGDWANELHPTNTGFAKIADKFMEKLVTVFA